MQSRNMSPFFGNFDRSLSMTGVIYSANWRVQLLAAINDAAKVENELNRHVTHRRPDPFSAEHD